MPFINSKISFSIEKKEEEILKTKLGKAIEIIPGKSESWLMLGFDDNYNMYFQGEKSPKIVFIEVKIFGTTTSDIYDKLTAEICNIYEEVLGVPKDKIYIKYEEVTKAWGWNGQNF